ncbi:TIGR03564 family F420-dependent LLM class oxidoreductase [Streptomyces sp. 4N509B]|uniref:TIGR03564 family F420-dependent LLM class oxidoreductase n=1 Tax=Streptomyces sp. 4N509B TaxID=3457413 RepID=UPI003FD00F4E
MRIGLNIDGGRRFDELVQKVERAAHAGYVSAWLPQSPGSGPRTRSSRRVRHEVFGYDSLTALAVAARSVRGIELGTCVVPTFPRHPMVLAEQALTVQAAYPSGRVTLGVGVSHRHVVEDQWGYRYDRTALRMREYLTVLNQLCETGSTTFHGETVDANGSVSFPVDRRVPVLVAALGPRMLAVAGACSDGVITWMTGERTLAEHIVPRLADAANAAGRPTPRVVASLPVCVTGEPEAVRERAARLFLIYRSLPNYRAVLDREDADHGGDIALVGSEEEIAAAVDRMAAAGVTDLNAVVVGSEEEQARTHDLLTALTDRPAAHQPGTEQLGADQLGPAQHHTHPLGTHPLGTDRTTTRGVLR